MVIPRLCRPNMNSTYYNILNYAFTLDNVGGAHIEEVGV